MNRPSFVNALQGFITGNSSNSGSQERVETQNDPEEPLYVDKTGDNGSTLPNHVQYNNVVIDSNMHPLFFHNDDHPGLVLISKKLIGPDNYELWNRPIQIALNARFKFVLVNGLYKKSVVSSPLCDQWERVNDMIITCILNYVANEISDGLNYVTTTSEVWT